MSEHNSQISVVRTDLQYLRAFAILVVVAYHANPDFFKNGYLGVDFFFCISGFVLAPKFILIAHHRESNKIVISFFGFVRDRFLRLYPALLLSILLTLPLILLTLPTGKYLEKVLTQAEFALFSLGNISAGSLVGDYFNPAPNPFLHLWSLGAEWQLYLFFAISACCLAFVRPEKPRFVFSILSSIVFISSLVLFLASNHDDNLSYYNPVLRMWEFGLGILAFIFSTKISTFKSRKFLYLSLGLLLAITLLPLKISFSHAQTVLLLLFFLPLTFYSDSNFQGNRIVLWVASRSYSIYLYHWIFFVIVKHSTLEIFESQNSKAFFTVIALCLALLVADLSYRFFETFSKPLNNKVIARLVLLITGCAILLISSDTANARGFWGYNNLNSQPKFAGDVDAKCDRTMVIDEPCTYGTFKNSLTLNLIGDSHAAALSSALVKVGEQLNFNVKIWSFKGCKYVDPEFLSESEREMYLEQSGSCSRRDSAFRNYISTHPYDVVLGAWRSQDCRSNEYLGLCGIPFLDLQLNSFLKLNAAGNRVVIFTPVPEFKDLEFFAPRSILQSEYVASYSALKEHMVRQPFVDEMYMRENSNGLALVSTQEKLCGNELCLRNKDDKWLYRDTNHLSIDGANILIPEIIRALQDRSA